MKKVGMTVAVSAVLMTSGCTSLESSAEIKDPVMVSEIIPDGVTSEEYMARKDQLTDAFTDVRTYWVDQGVPLDQVDLIIEGAANEVQCNDSALPSNPVSASYCRSIGSVVVTEEFIKYVEPDRDPDYFESKIPFMNFVAAHELGHAVQLALGEYTSNKSFVENAKELELGADCLAGRALKAVYLNRAYSVEGPQTLFIQGDDTHGTAQERMDSFENGFEGGDCSRQD